VAYTVTIYAVGDCGGSCVGSTDLSLQIATLEGFSPVYYIQSAGTSDYEEFTYTFVWTGDDGLSPVMVDVFLTSDGEAVALDDISVSYAVTT
jgi:hypothetical protein